MTEDAFLFYWINYDEDHTYSFSKKEVFKFYKDMMGPLYTVQDEEEEVVRSPRYPNMGVEVAIIVCAIGLLGLIGVTIANL